MFILRLGGDWMQELVPNHLISKIFKLNLEMRLIIGNKIAMPIIMKTKYGVDGCKILLDTGRKNLIGPSNVSIELKGKIDIEYLKYTGQVKLIPIAGEPGYYHMKVTSLYKVNQRAYKRVPYRRAIKITSPIECDGILINISGSGAMIQTPQEIDSDTLTIAFTLSKKDMVLNADIIEERYIEETESWYVRCQFNSMDSKSQKIILQAVKEITLMAKRRLQ